MLVRTFMWIAAGLIGVMMSITAFAADAPAVAVLYPKDHSFVGNRVNLVLDPATDSTIVPYFQAVVNNKTEYPVVDLSTGKHASQGLLLKQGRNVITVRLLAKSGDEKNKNLGFKTVSSVDITVYNTVGIASSNPPAGFNRESFHSREHEADCAGCHRLEVTPDDVKHKKPEDVLCFTCHKNVPAGKHIHGPAARWNCLGCHDPELYPFKYQFTSFDPWKVTKSVQAVESMAYTLSVAELFKPGAATLISEYRAKDLLQGVLDHAKQNPGDRLLLEVHSDNSLEKIVSAKKNKLTAYATSQALTDAQAKNLVVLLKDAGIQESRITGIGMGSKLPKTSNETSEGREINNRVEIVVHSADTKVRDSKSLPDLKNRERVLIDLHYARGPQIHKLSVVEMVPNGRHYVAGSGYFKGKPMEPRITGNELIWDLGDMEVNFTEQLVYVLQKSGNAGAVSEAVKVSYTVGSKPQSRELDPAKPPKGALTIKETCLRCHDSVLSATVKHGPADAGYCTSCHDPHASSYRAQLRRPAWNLCTTCHAERASGVHVLAGFVKSNTHPTRLRKDPMRKGKRLTCASCHNPHSAESKELFTYGRTNRQDMCKLCHPKN